MPNFLKSPLFSVTALVFLATAAWTGIVAADLITVAFGWAARPRRQRLFAVAQDHTLRPRLFDLDFPRDVFSRQLHGEQFLHNVFFFPADHLLEHVESLFLVLLERILLPVAAQTNTLFEMIHVQKMILPETVNGLQHDDFFQLPKHRLAKTFFLIFV